MLLLKVCGMRSLRNIAELINVQPDFIGFIFHENSPRNVIEIPQLTIPNTINKVGVFVNKEAEFIAEKVLDFKLDYIQLHGNESPHFCRKLKGKGYKIIKAFSISEGFDFSQLRSYDNACDYFLFDAFGQLSGGNGITFNWELINNYYGQTPFFLSGGIDETMTGQIAGIKHQKFVGVDINSGFEIAPALKNINKIKQFYNELRS